MPPVAAITAHPFDVLCVTTSTAKSCRITFRNEPQIIVGVSEHIVIDTLCNTTTSLHTIAVTS
jgi:hypothetical protein